MTQNFLPDNNTFHKDNWLDTVIHSNSFKFLFCAFFVLISVTLLLFPTHSWDESGWSHGFNHPLEGMDHLITMLGIGIWAAQMRGKAVWLLPLAFVGVMSLGSLVGVSGLSIPSFENIIFLSMGILGILILQNIQFSNKINVLIVAFFAFFHGFAHGQEISTSASLLSYTLGFMLATLILHGAGIVITRLMLILVTAMVSMLFSLDTLAHSNFKDRHPDQWVEFTNVHRFQIETLKTTPLSAEFKQADLHHAKTTIENFDALLEFSNQTAIHAPAKFEQNSNTKIYSKPISTIDDYDFKNIYVKWVDLNSQMRGFEKRSPCTLFSDDYPDINYSPGTHFASNGVGVNSPPMLYDFVPCRSVLPHSIFHVFRVTEATLLLVTEFNLPIYILREHIHSNESLLLLRPANLSAIHRIPIFMATFSNVINGEFFNA